MQGSQVALITPFTTQDKIDETALVDLVKWHIKQKTAAIVCCGTTGEACALSHDEKLQVIKICLDTANKQIPIIAGTGTNNTKNSIETTEKALAMGVSACLVVVPYYVRPSLEGCLAHFSSIAKTGAKIILYHHPKRTGTNLPPFAYKKMEEIKNIVAIKEASGDLKYFEEIKKQSKIPVLSGDDSLTIPLIEKGAKGVISVVANCIPSYWKSIVDLSLQKKFIEAKKKYKAIEKLCRVLGLETNPQCIKYILSLMGKCKNKFRLPLIKPSSETRREIEKTLSSLKII